MDSKASFDKLLKTNSARLAESGWDKRSLTYTHNEEGFRADTFVSDNPGIIFLGCSHTFGIGISDGHTWPQLVASHFNAANWNLGQPGGSNDTCFRLATHWIPKLKPQLVVMMSPFPDRTEILDQQSNVVVPLGPWSIDILNKKDTYIQFVTSELNGTLNAEKNIRGVKSICHDDDISCIVFSTSFAEEHVVDYARDLLHYGIKTNIAIATHVIDLIESNHIMP